MSKKISFGMNSKTESSGIKLLHGRASHALVAATLSLSVASQIPPAFADESALRAATNVTESLDLEANDGVGGATTQPETVMNNRLNAVANKPLLGPVSKDEDADGVPDDVDKCPGTPFGALVDRSGCSGDLWIPKIPRVSGPVGVPISPVVVVIGNLGHATNLVCKSDNLPAGLTIEINDSGTTCIISGTPTVATDGDVGITVVVEGVNPEKPGRDETVKASQTGTANITGVSAVEPEKCIPAAVATSLPLIVLLPIGLATQVHIPGLAPLEQAVNSQISAVNQQIEDANTGLQRQLGLYNGPGAAQAAQLNDMLKQYGLVAGQAVGGIVLAAAGILAISWVVDSCTGKPVGEKGSTASFEGSSLSSKISADTDGNSSVDPQGSSKKDAESK